MRHTEKIETIRELFAQYTALLKGQICIKYLIPSIWPWQNKSEFSDMWQFGCSTRIFRYFHKQTRRLFFAFDLYIQTSELRRGFIRHIIVWYSLLKNVFKINKLTAWPVVVEQKTNVSSNISNSVKEHFSIERRSAGFVGNAYWHNSVVSMLSITDAFYTTVILDIHFRRFKRVFSRCIRVVVRQQYVNDGRACREKIVVPRWRRRAHGYGNNLDQNPGRIQIRLLNRIYSLNSVRIIRQKYL